MMMGCQKFGRKPAAVAPKHERGLQTIMCQKAAPITQCCDGEGRGLLQTKTQASKGQRWVGDATHGSVMTLMAPCTPQCSRAPDRQTHTPTYTETHTQTTSTNTHQPHFHTNNNLSQHTLNTPTREFCINQLLHWPLSSQHAMPAVNITTHTNTLASFQQLSYCYRASLWVSVHPSEATHPPGLWVQQH